MDLALVRSLVLDLGMPHAEAARVLGVSTTFLAHMCSKHGILRRPRAKKAAPFDPEDFRRLIEDECLPQRIVAERLGIHRSTVERWCQRLGLQTQRTGPRDGEGHPGWGGGRVIRKGYWYVYQPDHPNATKQGYVLEHRLAMEEKLGRLLRRNEVVHHMNRDRTDNRPENLQLFRANGEHLRHELTGQIPNWSEAGKAAIRIGVEKSARSRRRRASHGS